MRTRVLIVDDHEPFRVVARELLEEAGYIVTGEANDAAAALAAVATEAAHEQLHGVEAHAWELSGRAESIADEYVTANVTYHKAIAAAERAGDDKLRASLYLDQALVSAFLEDLPATDRWIEQGKGLLERLQLHELEWTLAYRQADSARRHGDEATAEKLFRRALAAYTRDHPVEDHQMALIVAAIGTAQGGEDGKRTVDRAIAIAERALGANHPALISMLTSRGAMVHEDKPEAALPHLSVRDRRTTVGRDHASSRNRAVGAVYVAQFISAGA
jgi:CheY-like chemotaxis protein